MLNLAARARELGPDAGFTEQEIERLAEDAVALEQMLARQTAILAQAKAITAEKQALFDTVMRRAKGLVYRTRTRENYTASLGEALGFEPQRVQRPAQRLMALGPAGRPQLRVALDGAGNPVLSYARNGMTGILLCSRRGQEERFTLLAKQFGRRYVDDRPNLKVGEPEMRQYQGHYLDKDQPVGEMSDIVVVTVPGR